MSSSSARPAQRSGPTAPGVPLEARLAALRAAHVAAAPQAAAPTATAPPPAQPPTADSTPLSHEGAPALASLQTDTAPAQLRAESAPSGSAPAYSGSPVLAGAPRAAAPAAAAASSCPPSRPPEAMQPHSEQGLRGRAGEEVEGGSGAGTPAHGPPTKRARLGEVGEPVGAARGAAAGEGSELAAPPAPRAVGTAREREGAASSGGRGSVSVGAAGAGGGADSGGGLRPCGSARPSVMSHGGGSGSGRPWGRGRFSKMPSPLEDLLEIKDRLLGLLEEVRPRAWLGPHWIGALCEVSGRCGCF